MTILAVDNYIHRLNQLTADLRLVFPGERVIGFTDPLLAAQYGFNNPVDLLFSEINMRGMDGLTLSKGIHKQNGHMRVIFTSDEDEHTQAIEDKIIAGCLTRPVTEKSIRILVKNNLHKGCNML